MTEKMEGERKKGYTGRVNICSESEIIKILIKGADICENKKIEEY
jgi:hypothetical protein